MSITLTDLPAAVADYVKQNVTVEVSEVTYGSSTVLQPQERATFSVTVTNAADGIRLGNIVYDLSIDPPSPDPVAVLLAFGRFKVGRSGYDLCLPVLHEDDPTARLVVWPDQVTGLATLDPGQIIKFDDFSLQTNKPGNATVKCQIYASVDQASLFPADQPGSTVRQALTVQQPDDR